MADQNTQSHPQLRSAFGERNRLREEQKARQMAQLIAASLPITHTQNTPQQMVSLEEFNKVRQELEITKAQQMASLEEFNKVKEELERTKQTVQNTQQETSQYKPLYYDYQQKLQDQLDATKDFISNKLVQNSTARVLNEDMNFELILYAKEEHNVYISQREVKSLIEKFGIPYKKSGNHYYYYGVDLK